MRVPTNTDLGHPNTPDHQNDSTSPNPLNIPRDQIRAINHQHAIERGEVDERFGVLPAMFARFSLFPLSRPSDDLARWRHKNRWGSVSITRGIGADDEFTRYPFGGLARLFLVDVATEARRIDQAGGDPSRLDLTDTLNSYVRRLGVSDGGSRRKAVQEQLEAAARATVTFHTEQEIVRDGQRGKWLHTVDAPRVADGVSLWLPNQQPLEGFEPHLHLSKGWLDFILDDTHMVPVRRDLLTQLAGKPLAMDILTWMTSVIHTLHVQNRSEALFTWEQLSDQFTHEYATLKDFRKKWLAALKQAHYYYPDAQVEIAGDPHDRRKTIVRVERSPLLIEPKRRSQ